MQQFTIRPEISSRTVITGDYEAQSLKGQGYEIRIRF
jgi:hypothetical protein